MSKANLYKVADAGEFALPADRLLRVFEAQSNVSILAPTPQGPFEGFGVVDSIHTRALKGQSITEAVADLIKRNGGIKVTEENTYTIGGDKYVLPEGKLLRQFEAQSNIAIIDTAKAGTPNGGLGVVDSVHTRAYRNLDERREAIVGLLTRNGAQPIPAAA
jgi:hypothetical protein